MSVKKKKPPLEIQGWLFCWNLLFRHVSSGVEAVEVHDFGPCCHEVMHELFLCVAASVDFRDGAEPGVRAEDEVANRDDLFNVVGLKNSITSPVLVSTKNGT